MQARRVAGGSARYARSHEEERNGTARPEQKYVLTGDLQMPRAPCAVQENNPNVACRPYVRNPR